MLLIKKLKRAIIGTLWKFKEPEKTWQWSLCSLYLTVTKSLFNTPMDGRIIMNWYYYQYIDYSIQRYNIIIQASASPNLYYTQQLHSKWDVTKFTQNTENYLQKKNTLKIIKPMGNLEIYTKILWDFCNNIKWPTRMTAAEFWTLLSNYCHVPLWANQLERVSV